MSTNFLIIALVVILGGLILLLLLGGAFLFWRRRTAAKREAAAKKPVKRRRSKATPQEERLATNQPQPAAAPPAPTPPTSPAPAVTSSPKPKERPFETEGGEKVRILIVDDNPDTRDHVSRLLYFENDMEVIGQAINGRQGIEMAIEFKPHIVLMDINMPDMDGITATKEMSFQAPFSQVIIMSVQAERHYMKQAMAAGARDFQPKPFTSEELIRCVRRVYDIGRANYQQLEAIDRAKAQLDAQSPETGPGRVGTPVIALYSPKGGIGTSTLAANLAVALQREYGDIVLMDADLQFGDILVHLNTRATRTVSDLIHHDELDIELLPDILLPHNSGLKLLLAPPRPEFADAITPDMVGQIIKGLRRDFKMVLVDTHSKLDDKTMAILDEADYILLLTAPELTAIKSAKQFLELADLLEFGSDRLGVVINRANVPGGISIQQIAKVLKLRHAYFVPYDPRIHIAINKGIAVTQQDSGTPSAQAIARLAKEIRQRLTQGETQPVEEAA